MNKTKILKILSYIGIAIITIIAISIIYYILTTRIFKRFNVNYKPLFTFHTIVSNSMEPKLNIYDVVVDIRVSENTKLKEGDIITFVKGNSNTITHRIVKVYETENGTYYKTKGDNNTTEDDDLISKNDIIGKYLFKIPIVGRLSYKV